MMTPEQLKNSILQLAIEGKLVPQIASEGTGAELLEKIKTPQSQQVATAPLTGGKKSAKSKQKTSQLGEVANEVSQRGFPFAIPKTWAWCRLGEIVQKKIKRGKSPQYTLKSNTMVFAQKCNTKDGYIDMTLAYFLDESKLSKYDKQEFMCDSDVVVNSTGTGTMGRVGFFNDCDRINNMQIVPDSHVTIIRVNSDCFAKYVFYVLKNSQKIFEKNGDGSTNQKELKPDFLSDFLIPLPPLAEQKRIVAKLEELLPLVDEYAEAYNKLQTLNSKFPADLKKSLLQYAMEGKLVPQITSEGTGAELLAEIKKARLAVTVGEGGPLAVEGVKSRKLKKQKELASITDEEKPFAIPKTWAWCRLGDVCELQNGTKISGKNLINLDARYLRSRCDGTIKSDGVFVKKDTRLMLVDGENSGEVFVAFQDGYLGSTFKILDISSTIYDKFLLLFLDMIRENLRKNKKGAAIPHLDKKLFFGYDFPLPPLAEQKRIVAKLEELLPLCEELK